MNKYMSSPNALSRRQRKGPTHDHYSDDEDDSINMPISLNLGGNVFEYKNESWRRESSPEEEYREQADKLQEQVDGLLSQKQELELKCKRITEESNLIKFKNQLLVEMLAVASLDGEKHQQIAEKEQSKAQILRQELRHVLEESLRQGIKIHAQPMQDNNRDCSEEDIPQREED